MKRVAKMDLTKKASENADYYLSEQRADGGADKWFRYVKSLENYAEPVLVTPEMAAELLESVKNSFDLRKVAAKPSKRKKGEHPTVAISFSGRLLDGHSILKEIESKGTDEIVFFSFNVSDKIAFLFG